MSRFGGLCPVKMQRGDQASNSLSKSKGKRMRKKMRKRRRKPGAGRHWRPKDPWLKTNLAIQLRSSWNLHFYVGLKLYGFSDRLTDSLQ